jgi:methylenetetrahydrofolate reductase (NADPH)
MPSRSRPDPLPIQSATRRLLTNISYEVMPFKSTEEQILEHVPLSIPVTVTVTEAKGLETTLAVSERLAASGYIANPHLPARQIRDAAELADIAARLQASGIERIFVIGGDAPEPAGPYHDALALLRALDELGRPFTDIGVTGYPEGHAHIPEPVLEDALLDKAPYAERIVTQMCFDPAVITSWSTRVRSRGVDARIVAGIPGPVTRQKLVRISAGIGLGQSARFLQKQQGLLWRFIVPGAFSPDKLLRGLAKEEVGRIASGSAQRTTPNAHHVPSSTGKPPVWGLRIFTFNEIAGTERWRRDWLARLD